MGLYEQHYLKHYGVKGMKWGVRRTPEQLGAKRNKDADKLSEEIGKLAKLKSELMDTSKTHYVKGGSGNPIVVYDKDRRKRFEDQKRKTQDLVNKLERKMGYRIESIDNDWDEGGNMFVTVYMSKNGSMYASEMYNGRRDDIKNGMIRQ